MVMKIEDKPETAAETDRSVPEPPEPRTWRQVVLPALGVLLIGGLLVFGILKTVELRDQQADATARRQAVVVAERVVANLTTLSAKTSDKDIDRLLADTSPGFEKELSQMATALQKALVSGKVSATGKAVAAGVERQKGDKVVVVVAASGTVENSSTTEPEPRHYRLRVSIDSSSGEPLVSKIEFVA